MKTWHRRTRLASLTSLLLAAALLAGGCDGNSGNSGSSGSTPANSSQPVSSSGGAVTDERIDVNIIAVNGNFAYFKDAEGTPVLEEIQNQTNVNLTLTPVDADKWNVILAGGDTTDLLMYPHADYLTTLIDGELILPLDDLINQYGEWITKNCPERLDFVKEMAPDGKTVYCLPYSAGAEGGNSKATNSLLLTRWDYYKELGCPEIKNPDDYLNLLSQMQKNHPTTDDGLPVYGFSLYNADNALYPVTMYMRCFGTQGYNEWIDTRVDDNSFCYAYTEEDSPFWKSLDFFRKAYNLGLLDPDSFTQKSEDEYAKAANGQVLAPMWRDHIKTIQAEWLAEDPENPRGYAILPMEGTYIIENKNAVVGGAFSASIAKTCKNPERVMQFLNYIYSPEGARTIFSGVKGEHWDVIDGVAQPLDSAIQMKKESGDAWTKSGISNAALYGMVGMARGVLLDDGAPTDLYRSEGYFVKDLDAIDKDFCSYYGDYAYPNQVLLDKGTKDFSNLDMRIASGYGAAPEDIQRIDTKLLDMALKAIPTLIMAGDDDSFAKLKADTIQSFNKAGADQSKEWWEGRHGELLKKYKK